MKGQAAGGASYNNFKTVKCRLFDTGLRISITLQRDFAGLERSALLHMVMRNLETLMIL